MAPGLQLLDGPNLILVDAGLFAIELFEFVETGILVELWRVDGLDFATVIQGDHRRRCATGEGGKAQCEHESGEGPLSHELCLRIRILWLLNLRRAPSAQVPDQCQSDTVS
ncbi:hypothetical protein EMIT0P4_190059 [Pseudomonas sp. IT-P4]